MILKISFYVIGLSLMCNRETFAIGFIIFIFAMFFYNSK